MARPKDVEIFLPIIEYTENQVAAFKNGRRAGFPTYAEIGAVFHYHPNHIANTFRDRGFSSLSQQERGIILNQGFEPSEDLAEYIGFLSGKGYLNPEGKAEFTTSPYDNYGRRLFRQRTYELFNKEVKEDTVTINGVEETYYRFDSKDIIEQLGDLSNRNWGETINNRFSWIFSDEKYQDALMKGLWQSRKLVLSRLRSHQVGFYVTSKAGAEIIFAQMRRLGINRPQIQYRDAQHTVPKKVVVDNEHDARILAERLDPNFQPGDTTGKLFIPSQDQRTKPPNATTSIISPLSGDYVHVPKGINPKTCSFLLTCMRLGIYSTLPDDQSRLLQAYYGTNLSIPDLVSIFHLSRQSIRVHVYKALEELWIQLPPRLKRIYPLENILKVKDRSLAADKMRSHWQNTQYKRKVRTAISQSIMGNSNFRARSAENMKQRHANGTAFPYEKLGDANQRYESSRRKSVALSLGGRMWNYLQSNYLLDSVPTEILSETDRDQLYEYYTEYQKGSKPPTDMLDRLSLAVTYVIRRHS